MIGFVLCMYPHTEDRLCDRLSAAVKEMQADLLQSVWIITTDHTSSNSTMVDSVNFGLHKAIENCMEKTITMFASDAVPDAVPDVPASFGIGLGPVP